MVSLFMKPSILFLLCLLLQSFSSARSQAFIGVNYGTYADNLPTPAETAKLLQSTSIGKVRLYAPDPPIIKALAGTGIGIVIGMGNGDIPMLASDPKFASQWVESNVLAYYPASKIIVITVGNKVMSFGDEAMISQLLPAMQNLQNALNAVSLGGKIKVSTVHAMAVMSQSEPPSAGAFNPAIADTMKALLEFHKETGSPFMINPYPFFAYQGDPTRPENLEFCLFQPNSGRYDSGTGNTYMNMFDAQVDAVYSALNAMGFKDVEIVVAETGWAHGGGDGEVGASVENAKAYNGNLINHLTLMIGTPLMPGKSVDTYIFALYDEDLKPGAGSEREFGLFKPDLSPSYDVGLSKSGWTPAAAPVARSTPAAAPVTRTTPAAAPLPRAAPGAAPVARTTPAAAPVTRGTPDASPVAPGTPAAAPGAPGTPAATTPVGNPVTPTTASPSDQSAGIVESGAAISCRTPHSLGLVLVIMAAFILVKAHDEEEDKLL